MEKLPTAEEKEGQTAEPQADKLFWSISRDLEISARTQKPPSDELVDRLNHMASHPPFCWIHKLKKDQRRL